MLAGADPGAPALRPVASVVLVNEFTSYTICLIRLRSESIPSRGTCVPFWLPDHAPVDTAA